MGKIYVSGIDENGQQILQDKDNPGVDSPAVDNTALGSGNLPGTVETLQDLVNEVDVLPISSPSTPNKFGISENFRELRFLDTHNVRDLFFRPDSDLDIICFSTLLLNSTASSYERVHSTISHHSENQDSYYSAAYHHTYATNAQGGCSLFGVFQLKANQSNNIKFNLETNNSGVFQKLERSLFVSLLLPLFSGGAYKTKTDQTYPTPYGGGGYLDIISDTFTLANSSNKVLLGFNPGSYSGSSSVNFTVAVDGTPVGQVFNTDSISAGDNNAVLFYLHSPGDTASHTYSIKHDPAGVGASGVDYPQMFIIEVPSTVQSDQIVLGGGVGQHRITFTPAANSRVLLLASFSVTAGANTASYINASFQVDDVDILSPIRFKPVGSAPTVVSTTSGLMFVTDPQTNVSHNYDLELTQVGSSSVTDLHYIAIEIPE